MTKRSGKHLSVGFRWACNKRFRNAIVNFAGNSRLASPWSQAIYDTAIARGADHPHPIRILARAWTRIIYRCWVNQQPYNPDQHGAIVRQQQNLAA